MSWVEVDVRRTRDDALVVAHDAAYADGTFLVDLTASQVQQRGTLLLSELLQALPDGAGLSLDLKTCMEDAARLPGGRRPRCSPPSRSASCTVARCGSARSTRAR